MQIQSTLGDRMSGTWDPDADVMLLSYDLEADSTLVITQFLAANMQWELYGPDGYVDSRRLRFIGCVVPVPGGRALHPAIPVTL